MRCLCVNKLAESPAATDISVFCQIVPGCSKIDPTNHGGEDHENNLGTLIESAFRGDLRSFTLQYNLSGTNLVNSGDYDGRTALHLAATEGHISIVE